MSQWTAYRTNGMKKKVREIVSCHESGIMYTSSSWVMERLHFGSLLYIASSCTSHSKYKSSSDSEGGLWRNNKCSGWCSHEKALFLMWCKTNICKLCGFTFPQSLFLLRGKLRHWVMSWHVWLIDFKLHKTTDEIIHAGQIGCWHVLYYKRVVQNGETHTVH